MLKILFALALIFFQEMPIAILSPQAGETLRGQVNIAGNISVTNFASAEIAFSYASDPTSTWFSIQTFSTPMLDTALAAWDTTSLTDGDYTLRLRVYLQDGSFQEVFAQDLKIRNDVLNTPTSTPTATPAVDASLPLPTSTVQPAAVTPTFPTPTPLPANPAALTVPSIYSTFGRGALLTIALFFLVGIILRLRRS